MTKPHLSFLQNQSLTLKNELCFARVALNLGFWFEAKLHKNSKFFTIKVEKTLFNPHGFILPYSFVLDTSNHQLSMLLVQNPNKNFEFSSNDPLCLSFLSNVNRLGFFIMMQVINKLPRIKSISWVSFPNQQHSTSHQLLF